MPISFLKNLSKKFIVLLLVLALVIPFVTASSADVPQVAVNHVNYGECVVIYSIQNTQDILVCDIISPEPTATAPPTVTPTAAKATITPSPSATPTSTSLPTSTSTETALPTPTDEPTSVAIIQPFRDAELCPTHSYTKWHGLWDYVRGCHYDHEHGKNPFTPEVASTFPGVNLPELLCNNESGHCVPTSEMEFTHKHGGWKINVQLEHPEECAGFESAPIGVNGSVIGYHGFGNYAVELESATHSTFFLLRQCKTDNPTDYGYFFVTQHVSYGEIASPYQGDLLNYPYYSVPAYDPSFGPYITLPCIGQKLLGQRGDCRDNLAEAAANENISNWSAKPTGRGARPLSSSLAQPFWRVKDAFQAFDWSDQTYPYTLMWLCTRDGGNTFFQEGCEYNNSTTQMHEIQGTIPVAWDNLSDFDRDPRVGRITADGFVTRFGTLNRSCTAPGTDCLPIKMIQAFVGKYGSILVYLPRKGTNIEPLFLERDIYFCGDVVCEYDDPGAESSGWIGQNN